MIESTELTESIHIKRFTTLDQKVRDSVLKLKLPDSGFYQEVISRKTNPLMYLYFKEKELLGWGAIFDFPYYGNQAMFYVKEDKRRTGIGTKLAKEISKTYSDFWISRWSDGATMFADKVKVITKKEKEWC